MGGISSHVRMETCVRTASAVLYLSLTSASSLLCPLRPLAPSVDENGRRGCFAQLSAVEDNSEAAEVVVSPEAVSR